MRTVRLVCDLALQPVGPEFAAGDDLLHHVQLLLPTRRQHRAALPGAPHEVEPAFGRHLKLSVGIEIDSGAAMCWLQITVPSIHFDEYVWSAVRLQGKS